MRAITEQQKQEAIAAFAYEGTLIADTVYGSGHINDTFRLTFAVGNMGDLDVILQRMNADANCLMECLCRIIRQKPSGRMLWGGPRRFKRRSLFS